MEKNTHQFLLKELEIVNSRVVVLVTNDAKLLNLLLLIFGIGFGVGVANESISDYLLVFFPIAVYCVIFYFIHIYMIIESLLGYKKALDKYINEKIFGKVILISELINEEFHMKSKGLYFSYLGYSFLLALSIYKSIEKSIIIFNTINAILIIAGHLLFLFLIILTVFKLKNTFIKAYNFSKQKIDSPIVVE